jgi:hypothetical protein
VRLFDHLENYRAEMNTVQNDGFFTHSITGRLIKKVRMFVVATTTVYEHCLHGTGRFDDVSGFTFDPSQREADIYDEALEVADKQLEEGGMLIIIDDSDFADKASIEQKLEGFAGNQWQLVFIKLTDEDSLEGTIPGSCNQHLTKVQIRSSKLDEYFESLRMAQITTTQYGHLGASYVLH